SEYNFNGGIEAVLKSIIDKSDNQYFKQLASDILGKIQHFGNVNLTASDERMANGWSTDNTVSINFGVLFANNRGQKGINKFEEVFLHELLHAGTVNVLNRYLNSGKTNEQLVKEGILSKEQVVAAKKIKALFDEYRKNYPDQEKLQRFIEINNRRLADKNSISKEERDWLVENKNELYPLFNIQEFVAAGLTNE